MSNGQEGEITNQEILESITRVKELLKKELEKAKKRSDKDPHNLKKSEAYKTASLNYHAYLRMIELAGNLARTAQSFATATVALSEELRDREIPADHSKKLN